MPSITILLFFAAWAVVLAVVAWRIMSRLGSEGSDPAPVGADAETVLFPIDDEGTAWVCIPFPSEPFGMEVTYGPHGPETCHMDGRPLEILRGKNPS